MISILLFAIGGIYFLFRLVNPKNIFVKSNSLLGKKIIAEQFELEQKAYGIFEYDEKGFFLTLENVKEYYKWETINKIYGYKIDLYVYDEICIDVILDDENKFTITESTWGWYQFLIRLNENIESISKDWNIQITIPAFETNLTLLYDKNNV